MKIAKYWKPIAAVAAVVAFVALGVIIKMGHDGLERSSKAAAELEAAKAGSSQCYAEALQGGSAPACTGSPTTTSPTTGKIETVTATIDQEFDFAFAKANGQILVQTNPTARQVGRDYCAKADAEGAAKALDAYADSPALRRGMSWEDAYRATYAAVRSYCKSHQADYAKSRWGQ